MKVSCVDDLAHGLNAVDELAEVVDHLLPFDDLGVAGEGGGQQSLVHKWFKPHHDRVIWNAGWRAGFRTVSGSLAVRVFLSE